MRRVLVTGGAGFIGSHLVSRLVELGVETCVLDDLSSGRRANIPNGVAFIEGSVLDPKAVLLALDGVDVCFHLAAVASVARCNEQLVQSHAVNLGGFLTVVDASRERAPYLIYASSAAAYGDVSQVPLREEGPVAPQSPYGVDKYGCELHATAAARIWGLDSVGFRFFNVFGPGQDPTSPYSGVISKFASRLMQGETLKIEGDGLQTRDFIYVADVVDGLLKAADYRLSGARVCNLCTGKETSILDLASAMAEAFGCELRTEFLAPRDGDIRRSVGSPALFQSIFGRPRITSLSDGLRALENWTIRSGVADLHRYNRNDGMFDR